MITLLHISDPQFGPEHRFSSNDPFDTLWQRLKQDLDTLKSNHGLEPELVAMTGDLAERGTEAELKEGLEFLRRLSKHLNLPHDRIAIIPGNHDINWNNCKKYFSHWEARERKPDPPYWDKWEFWAKMFKKFYAGYTRINFSRTEPWTLFEMESLKVVVAGLNSTMEESHEDRHHYGHIGEEQLHWFANELKTYQSAGWLRIGILHHNPLRRAINDEENLRDADSLEQILGPRLNLLLHGHTHDGKMSFLGRNVPILSTGSAGLKPGALPAEIPNQYQIIRFSQSKLQRYTRHYAPNQKRWVGDNRSSDSGDDWRTSHDIDFHSAHKTFDEPYGSDNLPAILHTSTPSDELNYYGDIDFVIDIRLQWALERLDLEYRFSSPSGAISLSSEVKCQQSVQVPASYRENLLEELGSLYNAKDIEGNLLVSSEVTDAIKGMGHMLYERLFPETAKMLYMRARGVAKTLLIVSADPWIPWEILRPPDSGDDDFLCLQFEMSRWLADAFPFVGAKKVKRLAWVASEASRNRGLSPRANTEIHLLHELVSALSGIDSHLLEDPTSSQIEAILGNGLDVFHFAGYGEDGGVGSGMDKIELADRPFRSRQLFGPLGRRLTRDRPVVFLNAGGGTVSALGNWAEAWIRRGGASAFLSTALCPVRDSSGCAFAAAFYRELQAEQKLAAAARLARLELLKEDRSDLSWLSYRVYGNPNLRIVFGDKDSE